LQETDSSNENVGQHEYARGKVSYDQAFQIIGLDKQGGGRPVGLQDLEAAPDADPGLTWIHLDYSQTEAQAWLEETTLVDEIIKANLLDDNSRPRSMTHKDGLFISLRGVNLNPGSAPEDMVAVRLWTDGRWIITSNRRRLVSLEDMRQSLLNRHGAVSAPMFVCQLIEHLAERTENVVEALDVACEQLEDHPADPDDTMRRQQLGDVRHQAIRLKRYLSPQRDALIHLLNDAPPWITKTDKVHIRENLNQFSRLLEELESIRDRAVVIQEEMLGRLSEQLNKRMYALTLVATLFMPLGFLTGLLGINVGGIPGAESRYGFAVICVLIVLLSAALLGYLRFKKWF
jgi:zinc transporter